MRSSNIHRILPLLAVLNLLVSSPCGAQDDRLDTSAYGWHGLWIGADVGAAIGFLSIGSTYSKGEWRNVAFGTGLGVITGAGLGWMLGLSDAESESPARGSYVLIGVANGALLGTITGTIVGEIVMIDTVRPKDLLIGASVGALLGASTGLVLGIIAGARADTPGRGNSNPPTGISLTLVGIPELLLPIPGIAGRF